MSRDPRLDELLGAYELDALDDDERAEVAAYLERSPEARREADRLGAAVAALASASAGDAPVPADMWQRIRDAVRDDAATDLPPLRLPPPSAPPLAPAAATSTEGNVVPLARRRRHLGLKVAAAAAAIVVALGIGVTAGRISSSGDDSPVTLEQLAADALADPDARVGTLAGEGSPGVRVVVDPSGRGYLLAHDLPSLPPGQTYQLWDVADDVVLSLGVLGPDPGVVAFSAGSDTTTLAITAEAVPGVVASTQPPIVVGELS
jgi:anti-sigma factor RsiW